MKRPITLKLGTKEGSSVTCSLPRYCFPFSRRKETESRLGKEAANESRKSTIIEYFRYSNSMSKAEEPKKGRDRLDPICAIDQCE